MMNGILWLIAGGAVGWIGYSFMNLSEERSLMTSIALGMFGGFLGGKLVAPMFGAAGAVNPGDFSPWSLFMALASAAAILIISSMLHKRFEF